MTEETTDAPSNLPDPSPEAAPTTRRVAKPRPKKVVTIAAVEEAVVPAQESIPFPSPPRDEVASEDGAQSANDWPEPENDAAPLPVSQSESAKRKRRRRKGKGKSSESSQAVGGFIQEESHPLVPQESKPDESPQEPRPKPKPHQVPQPRAKVDPELLTKMAWKIYLAEVSEEGVALISDHDAKDLSRRCFRLAEIFIEEQARRR